MICKILFVVAARPGNCELCDIPRPGPEPGTQQTEQSQEATATCRGLWDMKLLNILNISGDFPDCYDLCNASADCGRPQPPESGSCLMVLQIIKIPLFACFQSVPLFEYLLLHYSHLLLSFLSIPLTILKIYLVAEYSSTIY